jgi:hypothetical protein
VSDANASIIPLETRLWQTGHVEPNFVSTIEPGKLPVDAFTPVGVERLPASLKKNNAFEDELQNKETYDPLEQREEKRTTTNDTS